MHAPDGGAPDAAVGAAPGGAFAGAVLVEMTEDEEGKGGLRF